MKSSLNLPPHFTLETDRKRILRFRPKTKLSSSSNNMRQSMYYYVNMQMMQHKYKITKILDTKIEYCSEG